MTRDPTHRGTQSNRAIRDENKPVGNVASRGQGCGVASRRIHDLLIDELAVMVIVADNGEVFAINPQGQRALRTEMQHLHWIVGTYTTACRADELLDDIRVMAKGMRRRVA